MVRKSIVKSSSTLNAWGKDPNKKFVCIHHSILSEGINVKGLEAVIFMRNMDYIGISQSIGRVIRLGAESKTFGLVCVPTYDSVGISTARKVQAVVDVVFNQGQPPSVRFVDETNTNQKQHTRTQTRRRGIYGRQI